MKNIGLRLAAAALAIAASFGCIGRAQGQCSAWANTMEIAANAGGELAIINTELSNGEALVFYADPAGYIAFTVGDAGFKELKDWEEDANGTATLKVDDDPSRLCTIACDGDGGLTLTIEGDGFTTLTWDIKAGGEVSMPGDVCGCSGTSGAATQNTPCNLANCNSTAGCRPSNNQGIPAGYCQAGSVPGQ